MTDQPRSDDLWAAAARRPITCQTGSSLFGTFLVCADALRLGERVQASWSTGEGAGELEGIEVLARTDLEGRVSMVMRLSEALAYVNRTGSRIEAHVGAADGTGAREAIERIRAAYPEHRPEESQRVAFEFTWASDHAVRRMSRILDVPTWGEIQANYPRATRAELRALMGRRLDGTGQTIIWHGDPGTGKTTALRALAWEWREWCDFYVVTDPDQLFGPSPSYLLELLSADANGRHRALVLEDAGEILASDARSFVGQGLSRFLNVCDGLLGQGEKLLLLVTTNEPLRRLHPAVSRAGRCAAEVAFEPLSVREANGWLRARTSARVTRSTPLADLFALASGEDPAAGAARAQPVGFAAALDAGGRR